MSTNRPILALHGISNLRSDQTRQHAAAVLARSWQPRLAAGYRAAGLSHIAPPELVAAYYADLLNPMSQGEGTTLDHLTPDERRLMWRWLVELGVPSETAQGPITVPLRQGFDWLARQRGIGAEMLARVMTAVLREVYVYLTRPALRQRVRDVVAAAIDEYQPSVIVAHSLGSVIGYETLHATRANVDLLVTLGSPLALPGAVFQGLDPEPIDGRGERPPGVRRWVNIADPGDLVAIPKRLGDRFPVDLHAEAYLGAVDFHTLGGYLACGVTATAIFPYVS